MRKIIMLALLTVPVSALGTYAFASDDASADDSRLAVSQSANTDISSTDDANGSIFGDGWQSGEDHEGGGHDHDD